ncbi:IclR family transcriptional regulator [Paracoccus cavernae]|uniref:IclR family transcriptional regulator n=1 Tax=Paracoccus cavernae TaxID=1571207 RepID=A0ABT8DD02_9RHOB|nr:IclR family transcriptional regulator [Paracoccus cavernae]
MTEGQLRKRTSGIDRTLQMLDILADKQVPMTVYELAKSAGAPASTIYRLVDELVERDMLSRREGNVVWLGPRLMRYGMVYRGHVDAIALAEQVMGKLARQTGETVQICTNDDDMMLVVAMAGGEGHFRISSEVGTRVPLNWTASGRLLLGHLSEPERIARFARLAQPSRTGLAETDPKVLSDQAAADFAARLAVQLNASEFSVACIAAPIRDAKGVCIATISIVTADRQVEMRGDELAAAVQAAALEVENAVGH